MPRRAPSPLADDSTPPRGALTPEAEENRLIALAYQLVEKRMREGTASSQETVHFLKLGSAKNRMEMENLRAQNALLLAKTTALEANAEQDSKYAEVIKALGIYRGTSDGDESEELYDSYIVS